MKYGLIMVWALTTALLGLSAGAALVNEGESWSAATTAGWEARDQINEVPITDAAVFSVSNGALRVRFPSYLPVRDPRRGTIIPLPMPPEKYLVRAGTAASGGKFTGDYLAGGVAAVSFRCYCDTPEQLWLVFQGVASERWWQLSLGTLPPGVWQTVTAPVQPAAFKDLMGAEDWAAFEQDIRGVAWIGILIRRSSALDPQVVLVDDFVLEGPGPDFAAWMSQYAGVISNSAAWNPLPDADLDRDGLDNRAEWIAGTSAADSNESLRIRIEPGQAGPRLKWQAKAGRVYNVWRSTDLRNGFDKVGDDVMTSGEAVYEDADPAGAMFYRIDVRKSP